MRLLYACRFDIPASGGWELANTAYQEWLEDIYRNRYSVAGFVFDLSHSGKVSRLPVNHELSSTVYVDAARKAVHIRWSFPDQSDPGLRWSNDVRLGQMSNICSVEHLISIGSVDYNVAPARLLFGSPRVVRTISTRTPIYVGDMQIEGRPYVLRDGGLEDFLALLTSSLRKLPIVLLSRYAHGASNSVDSTQLANNLAGVAVVVEAEDLEVTWDFADAVGRQLSCFNGAVRIYWPGFSKTADPRNHRLFLGEWIEKVSPAFAGRAIERAVFAVAAFRFVPDQRIADVIHAVEAAQRLQQLSEKRAAGDDFWKDYERDLAKLEQAELKIRDLKAENANLRANQDALISASLPSDELEEVSEELPISFPDVIAAVHAANKQAPNLEFLDTAYESAAASPFQRPYDIYQALIDLGIIVDEWKRQRQEKGSGGDLLAHLRNHGWGKRSSMHISDTTKRRFRPDYEFEYQGRKQLFEPHITIGAGDPNSCASIHFVFDQDRERMIVGHVGKHLPNTKT